MRVEHPNSPYYANVNVVNGYVIVQYCRKVLWPRLPSGRPGAAANRPADSMQRLISTASFDMPMHVVLDAVYATLRDDEVSA
jgi:hypothetical protein